MTKRARFLHGVVLPIAVMVVGLLILMNVESHAAAAEFGALGLLFLLIAALPITLIVNSVILLQEADTPRECFVWGMIVPGIVLVAAVVYQSGLWDRLT